MRIQSLVWIAMAGIPDRIQVLALDFYWVLISLWFVLPTGAVLGLYLPPSMAALSPKMAMKRGMRWGAACGIVCGILWATQLSLSLHAVEMLPWWILLFGVTMGIYSACCVALVALMYANREPLPLHQNPL
jgi:Na+/proline symporter